MFVLAKPGCHVWLYFDMNVGWSGVVQWLECRIVKREYQGPKFEYFCSRTVSVFSTMNEYLAMYSGRNMWVGISWCNNCSMAELYDALQSGWMRPTEINGCLDSVLATYILCFWCQYITFLCFNLNCWCEHNYLMFVNADISPKVVLIWIVDVNTYNFFPIILL